MIRFISNWAYAAVFFLGQGFILGLPALAQQSALNVLAFGDSGKPDEKGQRVARGMKQACDRVGCDAALMLGDNFYPDGVRDKDDPLFQSLFEDRYAALELKFYPVIGNHDLHQNAKAQKEYRSKRWQMMDDEYYEWTLPNRTDVQFFAINAEPGHLEGNVSKLERGLRESKAQWKVVYGHRPLYSVGYHGVQKADELRQTRDLLLPLLCRFADIYISGHEHDLEILEASCPNAKPLPLLVSGAASEARESPQMEIPELLWARGELGFAMLRFYQDSLDIQILDQNGERFADQNHSFPRRSWGGDGTMTFLTPSSWCEVHPHFSFALPSADATQPRRPAQPTLAPYP